MTILTVDQVREQYESDHTDDALQSLIDASTMMVTTRAPTAPVEMQRIAVLLLVKFLDRTPGSISIGGYSSTLGEGMYDAWNRSGAGAILSEWRRRRTVSI